MSAAKTDKTNYWALLAQRNINFGRDFVRSYEIVNGAFARCFEYRGQNFRTVKEIYQAVTMESEVAS